MGPKESQVHTEMWTQQVKEVFNHAQRKCPGQRWQEVGGVRESVESVEVAGVRAGPNGISQRKNTLWLVGNRAVFRTCPYPLYPALWAELTFGLLNTKPAEHLSSPQVV